MSAVVFVSRMLVLQAFLLGMPLFAEGAISLDEQMEELKREVVNAMQNKLKTLIADKVNKIYAETPHLKVNRVDKAMVKLENLRADAENDLKEEAIKQWLNDMEKEVIKQRSLITEIEKDFRKTLQEKTTDWSNKVGNLINDTEQRLNQIIHNETKATERKISKLASNSERVSAFSMTMLKDDEKKAGVMNFTHPILNLAGKNGFGYSNASGVFTAEKEGLYLLSCSFLVANGYVNLHMLKNGVRLTGRAYSAGNNGNERSGLFTQLVPMQPGDKVAVDCIPGSCTGVIRGDLYSTLSGFKL